MMKTIIAGSRNLRDYHQIEKAVAAAGWQITEVVSGKQKSEDPDGTEYGADFLGEVWAMAYFHSEYTSHLSRPETQTRTRMQIPFHHADKTKGLARLAVVAIVS